MKSDEQLKQDVADELQWDPAIDAAGIEIAVAGQVVTLRGQVPSYAQKIAVEKAVQRIDGVRAVVVELDIGGAEREAGADRSIAEAALAVLNATEGVPPNAVDVTVERGCVTLAGTLEWGFQRRAAELAVGRLRGVVGVVNRIAVRSDAQPGEVEAKIAAALRRRARADAKRLDIDVKDGVMTLRGTVASLAEKRAAHGVAWATRGVREVVDLLTVS